MGTRWYEQRKLGLALACLGRPRYRLAWDPACGTGHLAARLADRADVVFASDASPTAVRIAAGRCRPRANVLVWTHRLPDPPPAELGGRPDLVVLSEFLYYLEQPARCDTMRVIDTSAAPECDLVAVHWRHTPQDAWVSGADAQAEIVTALTGMGWRHPVHHRDEDFVLDRLCRTAGER